MSQQYNPGDVVQLRSGGPKMTVVGYDLYGMAATEKTYLCRWFDEKKNLTEKTFSEAELMVPVSPLASPVTSTGAIRKEF